MSEIENNPRSGGDKSEIETESKYSTEHLRVKLAKINNELQDTMKICENYKEEKQIAEKAKLELEESKNIITDLKRRLADSESNCKRYRNERNNLRKDISRLIDDRKQMVSYEEDVQTLQRDIEILKNKYDCDIREWKNKLSDTENKYEKILKEQNLKVEIAEQEVHKLKKELETEESGHVMDNTKVGIKETAESAETNLDTKDQSYVPDQTGDIMPLESIDVQSKMETVTDGFDTKKNEYEIEFGRLTGNFDFNKQDNCDSLNNTTEDNTHNAVVNENDGEMYMRDYKIKRRKIIEEYKTIDSVKQLHDDTKYTNDNCNEESDVSFENADKTSRLVRQDAAKNQTLNVVCESESAFNLAERYHKLYKNQWRNAYEEQRQKFNSDIETVTMLMDILQDVMNFCKQKAHEQIEHIFRVLTFSPEDQEEKRNPERFTKHLKECMREVSEEATARLFELYPKEFRKKLRHQANYDGKVEEYVKECIEICWLLNIHEDPIEFQHLSNVDGDVSDVYNPYKTSGQYINYVIWPALQYTTDGSILVKGIAEMNETCMSRQTEGFEFQKEINRDQDIYADSEQGEQVGFYQIPRQRIFGFHGRDKGERSDHCSNYSLQMEDQITERSLFKPKDTSYRCEDQIYSENKESWRLSKTYFSSERNDILELEQNCGNRGVATKSKKIDNLKSKSKDYSDSFYDKIYDSNNEQINILSYRENFRRKSPNKEEKVDESERYYNFPMDSIRKQPLHSYDITKDTRTTYPMAIIKTKAKGTTNVWNPSFGYERDPTPEEMRLYYRYIDHHDHTGARDVLGNAAYLRCLRKDHTQNFYN